MKDFFLGTWEFYKMAGWRGILCEMFNVNSNHHEMYRHALNQGMIYDVSFLDELISNLSSGIPNCEPFRTRAKCQLRGFKDAMALRSKRN